MSLEDRALADYVEQHSCRALAGIAQVGADPQEELVHATRTSLRRLRATVRTFPGMVAEPAAVDAALQAIALPLGAVRDLDVLAALLPTALAATEAGEGQEEARRLLAQELGSRRRSALLALEVAAGTPAWRTGAELLRTWCRTPPALAIPDAAAVLGPAEEEVRRRIRAARREPGGLHAARKASKRWRYAAEILAAAPGAAESRERAEQMQELLGQVQDLEIAGTLLAELLSGPVPGTVARAGLEALRALLSRRQQAVISLVDDAT